jgi:protein Tex
MKLENESPSQPVRRTVKAPEPQKVHHDKKTEQKKKPDRIKKAEPAKKTVFNTAMADALAKLKRN